MLFVVLISLLVSSPPGQAHPAHSVSDRPLLFLHLQQQPQGEVSDGNGKRYFLFPIYPPSEYIRANGASAMTPMSGQDGGNMVQKGMDQSAGMEQQMGNTQEFDMSQGMGNTQNQFGNMPQGHQGGMPQGQGMVGNQDKFGGMSGSQGMTGIRGQQGGMSSGQGMVGNQDKFGSMSGSQGMTGVRGQQGGMSSGQDMVANQDKFGGMSGSQGMTGVRGQKGGMSPGQGMMGNQDKFGSMSGSQGMAATQNHQDNMFQGQGMGNTQSQHGSMANAQNMVSRNGQSGQHRGDMVQNGMRHQTVDSMGQQAAGPQVSGFSRGMANSQIRYVGMGMYQNQRIAGIQGQQAGISQGQSMTNIPFQFGRMSQAQGMVQKFAGMPKSQSMEKHTQQGVTGQAGTQTAGIGQVDSTMGKHDTNSAMNHFMQGNTQVRSKGNFQYVTYHGPVPATAQGQNQNNGDVGLGGSSSNNLQNGAAYTGQTGGTIGHDAANPTQVGGEAKSSGKCTDEGQILKDDKDPKWYKVCVTTMNPGEFLPMPMPCAEGTSVRDDYTWKKENPETPCL